MTKIGPKAHLASSVINWTPYYTKVVNDMLAGTLKSEDSWWGIKEGAIAIVGLNPDVSTDVKTLLDEKTAAIKAGTLDPFQGPIVDQAGKKVLSAGKTMVPKELLNMNFYVKGVEGTPPK
jgi:basic membrane protein A